MIHFTYFYGFFSFKSIESFHITINKKMNVENECRKFLQFKVVSKYIGKSVIRKIIEILNSVETFQIAKKFHFAQEIAKVR